MNSLLPILMTKLDNNNRRIQRVAYVLKRIGADVPDNFSLSCGFPFSFDLHLRLEATAHLSVHSSSSKKLGKKYSSVIRQLENQDQKTLDALSLVFYLKEYGYDREQDIKRKLRNMHATVDKPNKVMKLYHSIVG